jgi:hypothetical protein
MAEKYFKRFEAEELLPMIGDCLEQAREQKQQLDELDEELARAATNIMVLGGSIPHYGELKKKRTEREQFASQVLEAVNKIQEIGCVVKDLDQGLVDFPSLLAGKEVYLCWKLGEERIGFWHGVEEGFAGRKPLDEGPADTSPKGRRQVQ